jgi:hypothetical protein
MPETTKKITQIPARACGFRFDRFADKGKEVAICFYRLAPDGSRDINDEVEILVPKEDFMELAGMMIDEFDWKATDVIKLRGFGE